jgi:ADP-ribose pyrophosphatase YjhB (NUDIX family)
MNDDKLPKWLVWAREIQQLAQTGLAFATNDYETKRYRRLLEIVAEMISEKTNLEYDPTLKSLINHIGYATPKIDIRAAVIKDNEILLVQECSDKKWAMPGGWADVGDIPSEVAKRETFEESGFVVKPIKVIGVYDANRFGGCLELFHAFKIIFLCKLIGGEPKISDETIDVKFFPLNNLPPLSLNRTNQKHIDEIILHLKSKDRNTYFD